MDIEELSREISDQENPVLIANEIGFFVSDGCPDESLSLYDALLLTDTKLGLQQTGATQPTWNYSLGISYLLELERLFVLAMYFNESRLSDHVLKRIQESIPMLSENRKHFSLEVAVKLFAGKVPDAIKLLIRENIETGSFDSGPYYDEVFPYNFIEVEKQVLAGNLKNENQVSDTVANLIAEIMVKNG